MENIYAIVIGSTNISEAHLISMINAGITIKDIATRYNSKNVLNLKSYYKINLSESLSWKNSLKKYESDLIIVANKSDMHKEIAEYSLNL